MRSPYATRQMHGDSEPEAIVLMRLRDGRATNEGGRKSGSGDGMATRERTPTLQSENAVSGNVTLAGFRGVKALLPHMTDGDNPLMFLVSLGHILELNVIDRMYWARLVPAQLSPRALKTFAIEFRRIKIV